MSLCIKSVLNGFCSTFYPRGVGDSTLCQNQHSFRPTETNLKKNLKKLLIIKIYSTTYGLNNRSRKYVHVTRFVPVIVILNGPLTKYLKKVPFLDF